jgi:FO synthase
MALAPELSTEDLQWTLVVARLIFGHEMNIQSPPNLLSDDYPLLLEAGINDWGGISPITKDFINPEAAWPQISLLCKKTAAAGFAVGPRLVEGLQHSSRIVDLVRRRRERCVYSIDLCGMDQRHS